ncbi:lipoate-protein ligase B [Candidatus Puniceispirillum marinum IMCC1322]|uniref:Octanoyltransferase n=2 Tax=Candidatus Puniceispirillum TaxID=767891 RepID=D5BQE8_PUNMI|nr:lipoate-protein ligase B [Candidatus Puniceispirillum marinum IMCC1322]
MPSGSDITAPMESSTTSSGAPAVAWQCFSGLQPYLPIIESMAAHNAAIRATGAAEAVWLLEHAAVYTGGTSARDADLLVANSATPTHRTGRGGQWTYHGPGQRIAYVMLDLAARGGDIRAYVHALEGWIIDIIGDFGVTGTRRAGLPGIWVHNGNSLSGYDKIAAIGVRVSRWVSWHGIAINLAPDLAAFDAIVPCGVTDAGVTSLDALGHNVTFDQLDASMRAHFDTHFGATSPLAYRSR